jgi:hypothetical protein
MGKGRAVLAGAKSIMIYTGSVYLFFLPFVNLSVAGVENSLFAHPGETPVTTGASLFPLRK